VLLAPVLAGMLVATFGEEVLYRGLMWRVLAPKMG
jgi:membrane protease YdiL (CAAX protease family)